MVRVQMIMLLLGKMNYLIALNNTYTNIDPVTITMIANIMLEKYVLLFARTIESISFLFK